jgi:hypothetical protein
MFKLVCILCSSNTNKRSDVFLNGLKHINTYAYFNKPVFNRKLMLRT